jgi:hypothetical protein
VLSAGVPVWEACQTACPLPFFADRRFQIKLAFFRGFTLR